MEEKDLWIKTEKKTQKQRQKRKKERAFVFLYVCDCVCVIDNWEKKIEKKKIKRETHIERDWRP